MADTNRLSIQPVWGTNRKLSYGVLDAAESILQNIDELSDVLDQLTEKYDEAQVRYFAQSFVYVGHFGKHRQHSGFFWKFKADEEEKYIEPSTCTSSSLFVFTRLQCLPVFSRSS